ncbi:carboxypeptidase-like regulatory domain-containing protein [Nonlabens sp.]|uniref:carboxypeptidase-like regulatory domain-containing protein n=1 Tax=Nonlabens sp. TaxID=1888209 RepID=UPI003F6A1F70
MRLLLCFVVFLGVLYSYSQKLTGNVIDSKTKKPLSGVTVYIDGTTVGVITNLEGEFSLKYSGNTEAKLVLRMIGYETLKIENPSNLDLSSIQLIEKIESLDTVFIDPDPWTRERKENQFIKYFIGGTELAKSCKIINLDSIRLRFNPSTAILSARSEVPIKLENKELGYLVEIDLDFFDMHFRKINRKKYKIIFKNNPTDFSLSAHYIEGASTARFTELYSKERELKRSIKRRKNYYPLSSLYFYRTLCEDDIERSSLTLYYDNQRVEAKNHIRVRKKGEFYKISFRNEFYTVVDSKQNESIIAPVFHTILINKNGKAIGSNGIATNKGSLIFQGHFARLGKSGLLPTDYQP